MSISKIPPDEFALIAALLGVAIANNLNVNEQNSIGNFFELLGQTLLTISAQAQLQQSLISSQIQREQNRINAEILAKQAELLKLQIEQEKLN